MQNWFCRDRLGRRGAHENRKGKDRGQGGGSPVVAPDVCGVTRTLATTLTFSELTRGVRNRAYQSPLRERRAFSVLWTRGVTDSGADYRQYSSTPATSALVQSSPDNVDRVPQRLTHVLPFSLQTPREWSRCENGLKANTISAARLTQRVPWLCVSLLREICLFRLLGLFVYDNVLVPTASQVT